ncbi:hypothetical protein [Fibrobacter sp. UWEL]|uniref:hypothetical protein n=1 Tax=Fibrobacter sp. UWEL TaxID=1896209 RepID=UPI00091FF9C7|nr:hypothetical protein [Fibrobacter sp. UWEL]SHK53253.1 hypothetical protein SAMN05720468_10321 [Fibrobacter sp. UWEL]
MSAKKSIYTFFTLCISLGVCGALTACLDVPSEPSSSGKAKSVSVYVVQNSVTDSTLLKINTQDSAKFVAQVKPSKYEDQLTYTWYHDDDKLASGISYTDQFLLEEDVPNRVVVKDKEGNTLESNFTFILNTPPRLSATMIPADSTVFTIGEKQSIEFKWYYYDSDDNDEITSYLTLDNEVYTLGSLSSIVQSGFSAGEHSFSITVVDKNGDKASSKMRVFFVERPGEDSK